MRKNTKVEKREMLKMEKFEKFKSLAELTRTISKRKVNEVFAGRFSKALEISPESTEWTKSNSYEHAEELIIKGYKEPMNQIKKGLLKIKKEQTVRRAKIQHSVVGYAVSVPLALTGVPECMFTREKVAVKSKTLHLVYGFSALGDVSPRDLINGGINFIGLVNTLEKNGYRVKIDIVRCTTTEKTAIGYLCNVKEYNQPLNLLKLCYPLVNPSMLRRTSFRWCETLPDLKDNEFNRGYGASLIARFDFSHEAERQYLKDNKIIDDKMFYCNVYQAFEAKNIDELAETMGLTK